MKFLIAMLIVVNATLANAQTNQIVSIDAFDLSYTGGLLIKSDDAKEGKDRDETTFRFNVNYARDWEKYVGLMWKAKAYFNREDIEESGVDSLYSRFGVAGGLLYNFQPEDVKNSFYAGAMLGLERTTIESGDEDESGFTIVTDFEGGKRWDMGRYAKINISYAPSVAFTWKRYGGGVRDEFYKSGTELKFNFLKFDILF